MHKVNIGKQPDQYLQSQTLIFLCNIYCKHLFEISKSLILPPKVQQKQIFFHRRFVPTSLVKITKEIISPKNPNKRTDPFWINCWRLLVFFFGGGVFVLPFFKMKFVNWFNSSHYTHKTLNLQNKLHLTRSEGHFLEGHLSQWCFFFYQLFYVFLVSLILHLNWLLHTILAW